MKDPYSQENFLHGLYFIYYTGHGININGRTFGVDKDGDYFPIEDFVNKAAVYKNTTVIGFFDCCRTDAPAKGHDFSSP
jgi:hypothetical protein